MVRRTLLCLIAAASTLLAADEYKGPRPPKPDVPYLLQADNLIETETATATESHPKKDEAVFTVQGTSSTSKTPLAEPSFLMQSRKLSPQNLQLYRFVVSNGNRQVILGKKHNDEGPFHLSVRDLGGGLYRIDVGDSLENGEYSLSPSDSNTAFCFAVVD